MGTVILKLTLTDARKIFIYDNNNKNHVEDLAQRKSIIKQLGYFSDLRSKNKN